MSRSTDSRRDPYASAATLYPAASAASGGQAEGEGEGQRETQAEGTQGVASRSQSTSQAAASAASTSAAAAVTPIAATPVDAIDLHVLRLQVKQLQSRVEELDATLQQRVEQTVSQRIHQMLEASVSLPPDATSITMQASHPVSSTPLAASASGQPSAQAAASQALTDLQVEEQKCWEQLNRLDSALTTLDAWQQRINSWGGATQTFQKIAKKKVEQLAQLQQQQKKLRESLGSLSSLESSLEMLQSDIESCESRLHANGWKSVDEDLARTVLAELRTWPVEELEQTQVDDMQSLKSWLEAHQQRELAQARIQQLMQQLYDAIPSTPIKREASAAVSPSIPTSSSSVLPAAPPAAATVPHVPPAAAHTAFSPPIKREHVTSPTPASIPAHMPAATQVKQEYPSSVLRPAAAASSVPYMADAASASASAASSSEHRALHILYQCGFRPFDFSYRTSAANHLKTLLRDKLKMSAADIANQVWRYESRYNNSGMQEWRSAVTLGSQEFGWLMTDWTAWQPIKTSATEEAAVLALNAMRRDDKFKNLFIRLLPGPNDPNPISAVRNYLRDRSEWKSERTLEEVYGSENGMMTCKLYWGQECIGQGDGPMGDKVTAKTSASIHVLQRLEAALNFIQHTSCNALKQSKYKDWLQIEE